MGSTSTAKFAGGEQRHYGGWVSEGGRGILAGDDSAYDYDGNSSVGNADDGDGDDGHSADERVGGSNRGESITDDFSEAKADVDDGEEDDTNGASDDAVSGAGAGGGDGGEREARQQWERLPDYPVSVRAFVSTVLTHSYLNSTYKSSCTNDDNTFTPCFSSP